MPIAINTEPNGASFSVLRMLTSSPLFVALMSSIPFLPVIPSALLSIVEQMKMINGLSLIEANSISASEKPYYIFNIQPAPAPVNKELKLINEFEKFQDAKKELKNLRVNNTDPKTLFKTVLAENVLEAEEMLMETREKPFLAEWEQ